MAVTHNLTHDEARARSALLDVDSYSVDLDLTRGDTLFGSTTSVRFVCATPGAATFIEVSAERIVSASLNGEPVDVSGFDPAEGLRLTGLAADNTLVIVAEFAYSDDGEGLYRLTDPADGSTYLYTHFEANNAQRVYACFDQPDLKARFTFTVTLPSEWTAVSNMPVERRAVDADSQTVRFAELPRTSTYLTALCAGPLHHVRDTHDGIELGLYCRASMAEHLDAAELFALTKGGLDHYHRHFGVRFPLPKYDQVAMPEYNSGATENFGCVVYAEQLFVFSSAPDDSALERRAYIMFHEMAHMWFGDLVTPRWWDETWLKEAFATWAGLWTTAETTRFTHAWTTFTVGEKNAAYTADDRPTTHPVYAAVPDVKIGRANFDAITYCKGGSILRQLAALLGIDDFTAGLRDYFAEHAFDVAEFADLRAALEKASGQQLDDLARQWLSTTGFNRISPRITVDETGAITALTIEQDGEPARRHRITIGLYDVEGAVLRLRRREPVTVDGATTAVTALIGETRPDVVLLDDTSQSYVGVDLDDTSLRTILTGALPDDPLARAVVWSALWRRTRELDLAPETFLDLIADRLPADGHTAIVSTMQYLTAGTIRAVDDSRKTVVAERLAESYARATDAADPGSRLQLTWATAFTRYARAATTSRILRDWLTGTNVPDGLRVDQSLRWDIVHALAAAGELTDNELDSEAERDTTTLGRLAALTARAARRDAEAKEESWRLLEDPSLSAADQRAILSGFWQFDQSELLRPYVTRFLDLIDTLWDGGHHERAGHAVHFTTAFPTGTDTIEALDRWLSIEDRPATLRRFVTEARSEAILRQRSMIRD
ncbi:aminopeptidase N [Stackebrandtia soli]|uniref:aminopeptidase N n=1 Tax=Stackebrandtia soli TaxID=1892856 RepID=UPI0039E86037